MTRSDYERIVTTARAANRLHVMLVEVLAEAGACDLSYPGRCIRHGGRLPCVFAMAAALLADLEIEAKAAGVEL